MATTPKIKVSLVSSIFIYIPPRAIFSTILCAGGQGPRSSQTHQEQQDVGVFKRQLEYNEWGSGRAWIQHHGQFRCSAGRTNTHGGARTHVHVDTETHTLTPTVYCCCHIRPNYVHPALNMTHHPLIADV